MSSTTGNIILIGMMGSGKTTIGKALAESRGLRFADTDALIVRRMKMPVSDIFARYGEKFFRALEADTALLLNRGSPGRTGASCTGAGCTDVGHPGAVIATGGGMVLARENMKLLGAGGTVVYLRARPETLLARVLEDTERPLLAESSPEEILAKITALLRAREALYERYSDFVVDTDNLSVEELIEELKERIP